ncbi:MAG: sigma-70 family RNA polymerase sigma factor [Clostridia bacterium]|nr:sigma-70 family RNA polymerase sigma factor [Clostridia bacterium]
MDKNREKVGGHLSDETIIELYWNREERAIKATDEKYGKYLFTIAYNIVRNELDCEECLDDTYLGAWNSIPPKRPTAFQVFLAKIMRNVALDRFRKKSALRRVPSELIVSLDEIEGYLPYDVSLEEAVIIKDISRVLSEYLNTLSERDEFIFVCRYYYFDTISDIAKMMDLNSKTVSKALANAREGLRDRLMEEGYKHE